MLVIEHHVVIVVRGRSRAVEIDTQDEKTEKAEKPSAPRTPALGKWREFYCTQSQSLT